MVRRRVRQSRTEVEQARWEEGDGEWKRQKENRSERVG
jgi:hypothetical protein